MHRQTMEQQNGWAGDAGGWMQRSLHDLCQPLTALQCRLALATMVQKSEPEEELAELRAAVQDSMVECERMIGQVRTMQYGMADSRGHK